jgi:hypothetical protein
VNRFENSILDIDWSLVIDSVQFVSVCLEPYIRSSLGRAQMAHSSYYHSNDTASSRLASTPSSSRSPQFHIDAIVFVDDFAIYPCAVTGPATSHWSSLTIFDSLGTSRHVGFWSTEPDWGRTVRPQSTPEKQSITAMVMTTVGNQVR